MNVEVSIELPIFKKYKSKVAPSLLPEIKSAEGNMIGVMPES